MAAISTATAYKTHTPETNFGTVTSWLPLTTAFPLPTGCLSSIWARWGFNATANFDAVVFDPGYGITVDTAVSCIPAAVTQWWETSDPSLTTLGVTTRLSIGPLVCPEAYTNIGTSIINSASTQVVCCPSGYKFRSVYAPGIVGECTSPLSAGAVVTYAMLKTPANTGGGVKFTSTTLASAYYLLGVPINGMLFGTETTSSSSVASNTLTSSPTVTPSGTSSTITSSTSSLAPTSPPKSGLPTGAVAGIAVGASLLGIAIIALIVFFALKRKRSTHPPLVMVNDSYEFPDGKIQPNVHELNQHGQYPELHGQSQFPELPVNHHRYEVAG